MNIEYYKGKISATEEMLKYKSPDYELSVHQSNLKDATSELLSKRKEFGRINEQITEKIKVCDEVKSRMSDHLGRLLNLLRIAKEIAEIKLDKLQTEDMEIARAGEIGLPKDLEDSIKTTL